MSSIHLYTDGSCLGNPGPGGWAAIVRSGEMEKILCGGDPRATNNRMEMKAVVEGLKWIKLNKKIDQRVEIFTDSSLLVNTMNQAWKRKNNLDLWKELDEATQGMHIVWNWVKGHAGHPFNERCDAIAVKEAEKIAQKTPGSLTRKFSKPFDGATTFHCNACGVQTEGQLGYLSDSNMIRVDCPNCARYIKFAEPNFKNLKRAKKRMLVNKAELETLCQSHCKAGRVLTENELKKIKAMTFKEAQAVLNGPKSLF